MRNPILIALFGILLAISCQRNDAQKEFKDKIQPPQINIIENEALGRRQRSIAQLRGEKVPALENLPVIETEAEAKFRTTEEAAQRAMALCIIACKAEGLNNDSTEKLIADFQLANHFTPKERSFLSSSKPSEHDRIQFVWRYECYWVLLWALGFVDDLKRPENICDVKLAVGILRDHGREQFLKMAKLRSKKELLDAADLIYRYHWAVTDARINGRKAPAGLDSGVVLERHYVMNWLVGYGDQDWDDVTTDT